MEGPDNVNTRGNSEAPNEAGHRLCDEAYDRRGDSSQRHRKNDPPILYPLPEVEPFVIINANPGEVRPTTTRSGAELTPDKVASSNPGEVRPGIRVQ